MRSRSIPEPRSETSSGACAWHALARPSPPSTATPGTTCAPPGLSSVDQFDHQVHVLHQVTSAQELVAHSCLCGASQSLREPFVIEEFEDRLPVLTEVGGVVYQEPGLAV